MAVASPQDDSSRSAIDVLSEGTLREQLGIDGNDEGEGDEPKVEEPKVDPDVAALKATVADLQRQQLEDRQELQFHRGALSNIQRPAPKAAEPEPELEFNFDDVTKDIETRGTVALKDFVNKIVSHEVGKALKEADKRVDGKLGAQQASAAVIQRMRNEFNEVTSDYAEFWDQPGFKEDVDKEAGKVLEFRIGRAWQSSDDNRHYAPGDLLGAASRVARRWDKEGKLPGPASNITKGNANTSSLREITRRVPANDPGTGTRGQPAKAASTIDEIDMPANEKAAAKSVFKKLKALNPQLTEKSWVDNYHRGERNRAEA